MSFLQSLPACSALRALYVGLSVIISKTTVTTTTKTKGG
jgi:hypothetical protein